MNPLETPASLSAVQKQCPHCLKRFWGEQSSLLEFCCQGCERVYSLIQSCGLGSYYLEREAQALNPAADVSASEFLYLDQLFPPQKTNRIQFYIRDIQCSSCIWVLERLPRLNYHISEARVSMLQNSIQVTYDGQIRPSEVAQLIRDLGYTPSYLEHRQTWDEIKNERKSTLARIAVAGFAAGNTMLYAIAVYAGADPVYQNAFTTLSAILYLPVFFYSSMPLYRSAIRSIHHREFGVDVPLCLALFFGSLYSYFSILTGSSQLYFDTLSSLVFLILISRFLLRELELGSKSFLYLNEERHSRVPQAKKDEILTLNRKERLSFDGVLLSDSAEFDSSWIHGESRPMTYQSGALIPAGTIVLSQIVQLRVVHPLSETEFHKQLEQAKQTRLERPQYLESADRWARVFLAVIVVVAIGLAIQGHFDRAMALLVISCPCALSLASPMTYSLAIREFFKRGLILKSTLPLEKIARAKTLFFDKTGTLSEGSLKVAFEKNLSLNSIHWVRSLIYSVERGVHHPIALSLRNYIEEQTQQAGSSEIPLIAIHQVQILEGVGVEAITDEGFVYRIQKTATPSFVTSCELVRISPSYEWIALYGFEDRPREYAAETIQHLKKAGYAVQILSGDHTRAVRNFARQIGIPESDAFGDLSAEEKASRITSGTDALPTGVMLGDGMNDGLALSKASVGVVAGQADPELNADVLIQREVMPSIEYLVLMSRYTFRVLDQNIAFSALYNSVGLVAACMGWVSPLLAAILMPLSAISVFINAVIQIRFSSQKIARHSCRS